MQAEIKWQEEMVLWMHASVRQIKMWMAMLTGLQTITVIHQ